MTPFVPKALSYPFVTSAFETEFAALFRGRASRLQDHMEWTQRLNSQREEAASLAARLRMLQTEAARATLEEGKAKQAHEDLKRALGALRTERDAVQTSLTALQEATKAAHVQKETLERELVDANAHLGAAVADRDRAQERAQEAQSELDGFEARLVQARADRSDIEVQLASATEALDRARAETREIREGLDSQKRALEYREQELDRLVEAAQERATGAALALQEATSDAARLRAEARAEVLAERLAWDAGRQEQEDEAAGTRRERDAEFNRRATELDELEADLELEREDTRARIERRVEKATSRTANDLKDAHAELSESKTSMDKLRKENARLTRLLGAYKGRDLSEMDAELQVLQDRVTALIAERDARMTPEETKAYRALKKQARSWASEQDALQEQLDALDKEKRTWAIDAASAEMMEGTADKWEALYRQARADLDQLCERANAGTLASEPFPRLSKLDADDDLRSPADDVVRKKRALTGVLDDVGQRLARPRGGPDGARAGLKYDRNTLRRYLAGMAMSRWILLEGDPGTGKTTLAVEFAQALGAGYGVVSVQAGWRDRNDLIGHYNTFERQYHETDFLEHLYRAQTRRHRNLPYFIVLDEVNVSRPEYYFADFLSLLELQEAGRRQPPIPMLAKPLDDSGEPLPGRAGKLSYRLPSGLEHGGTQFPLPPNVWFVGTANDDESTLTPAPRTYDRAHVQYVAKAMHPIEVAGNAESTPSLYSLDTLSKGFDAAQKAHVDHVTMAIETLEAFQAPLKRANLGWTNRLERQIARYLPAYLATGSDPAVDVADALDHLLSTKVLLKLRGDYNRSVHSIETLAKQLKEAGAPRGVALPESLQFLEQERAKRASQ